jgi:hypothetical protein
MTLVEELFLSVIENKVCNLFFSNFPYVKLLIKARAQLQLFHQALTLFGPYLIHAQAS